MEADIRDVRLHSRFDAVVSLFHVMSYQVTNEDIRRAFETARAHLDEGGIFIFDCWYGPAVLTERPEVRVKRVENEEVSITRIAEPVMLPNENVVEVQYHLFAKSKTTQKISEVRETHRMRYWFQPEIEVILSSAGLRLIQHTGWMGDGKPGFDTWNTCFVAGI
jgi:SAM-dependent methyltransferase